MLKIENKNSCWIEISKKNLLDNILNIKKISNKPLLAVIKANAYGHGTKEIFEILNTEKSISFFCLQYENEFNQIVNLKNKKNILILSPLFDEFYIKNFDFHYTIFSINSLKEIIFISNKFKKKINIHLKIDIGMHRLGLFLNEIEKAIDLIFNCKNINLYGVMTHGHDSRSYCTELTKKEFIIFNNAISSIKKIFPNIITHGFASGFIDIENNYDFNRCGGYLYGFFKSKEQKNRVLEKHSNFELKQIISLKSKIIQIKNVLAGSYIGYSKNCIAAKDMVIAIISMGYSDGYNIKLSNNVGLCIVNNQVAKICGIISMGLITIDITNLLNIKIGDTVTFTDPQNEIISVDNISEKLNISSICFTATLNSNIIRKIIP